MPSSKIRLFCDWGETSCELAERLLLQTRLYAPLARMEFVNDETYEHAVIFNYTNRGILTPPEKNLGLVLEPPEIVSQMFDERIIEHSRGLATRYDHFAEVDGYTFAPGLGFTTCGPWSRVNVSDKPKKVCMIVSDKLMTPYHHKRRDIFEALLDTPFPIDFYGRGMPSDWDSRMKGEIPPMKKYEVLREYAMCIDFENSPLGVITDKYFDPIMNNCIPITNAKILDWIGIKDSYRLVDFDAPVEDIVAQIEQYIETTATQMDNISVLQAKKEILCGSMSLARWIYEGIT